MNQLFFLRFVDLLFTVLWLAIFVRVLLSWFPQAGNNAFGAIIWQLTEPILAPIRRVLPRVGMFDFTPMVALFLLWLLRELLYALISGTL